MMVAVRTLEAVPPSACDRSWIAAFPLPSTIVFPLIVTSLISVPLLCTLMPLELDPVIVLPTIETPLNGLRPAALVVTACVNVFN